MVVLGRLCFVFIFPVGVRLFYIGSQLLFFGLGRTIGIGPVVDGCVVLASSYVLCTI
jgi:hypothetical protein